MAKRLLFILNGNAAVDIDNSWWNKFFSYTEQEFCSSCKCNLYDKFAWEREANGLEKTEIICTDCVKTTTLGELIDIYKAKAVARYEGLVASLRDLVELALKSDYLEQEAHIFRANLNRLIKEAEVNDERL